MVSGSVARQPPEGFPVIRPFYFGPDGGQLLAVYHPPQAVPSMPIGVLLCNPTGFERARIIRSFACLASELAQRGFAVLRFDYAGTGTRRERSNRSMRSNGWAT